MIHRVSKEWYEVRTFPAKGGYSSLAFSNRREALLYFKKVAKTSSKYYPGWSPCTYELVRVIRRKVC